MPNDMQPSISVELETNDHITTHINIHGYIHIHISSSVQQAYSLLTTLYSISGCLCAHVLEQFYQI